MSFLVNPYAFAAAGLSRTIAVQDFQTGSSTGAQSYTSSTISGVTPDAVLIVSSSHDPANDATDSANAQIGVGVVTASDYDCAVFNVRDARTTSICSHASRSNLGFLTLANESTIAEDATAALVSGGVQLTYTTNDATNRRAIFAAFTGCSAAQGIVNLGTGTSAIDVTGPGFQPDVVIFYGVGENFVTSGASLGAEFTFGIATSDGTQRCLLLREAYNAATTNPVMAMLDDSVCGQLATSGSLDYKVVASDFDASGFSLTPSASAGSDRIGYLALKFTGRDVKLADFTTPTSTGSASISGAGFTPQFALAVLSNLEALNGTPVTSSDNSSCFAISLMGDEQWATTTRYDALANDTDARSLSLSKALLGSSGTDTDAIIAGFTAFDSDGVTVDYTAVQGTGKKGFILFIE